MFARTDPDVTAGRGSGELRATGPGSGWRASAAVRGPDRIYLSDSVAIPALAITPGILDLARTLPPAVLRSLDAIHLATAMLAGDELDHVITYDRRMAAAAEAAGLGSRSPS
jgi:uncharacterized protein